MYWLQRPPYLRWAAAGLVVIGAIAWEARPSAVDLHPFLIEPVAAGEAVTDASVEWRETPSGLLAVPDLSNPVAAFDLAAGVPLLDGMFRSPVVVPAGWWTVPIAVGGHARPGDRVMLVVVDPPMTAEGVVVTAQQGDRYGLDFHPAAVAVPAAQAPLIAAAAAQGGLVAAVSAG